MVTVNYNVRLLQDRIMFHKVCNFVPNFVKTYSVKKLIATANLTLLLNPKQVTQMLTQTK